MKYCKAYPIDIRITKEGVTLNDLEHTMLSLFWEKDLNKIDRDYLLDCYKTERMQYLDDLFPWTEQNYQKLKSIEKQFLEAMERMRRTLQRMADQEAKKLKRGEVAASMVCIHLEIANLEDSEERAFTEDERDLWNFLCGEDRSRDPWWGFTCLSVEIDKYVKNSQSELPIKHQPCKHNLISYLENNSISPKNFNAEFCLMKNKYGFSWQDMILITDFWQTVEIQY